MSIVQSEAQMKAITANLFLNRLQQRVSKGNAKLILDAAKVQSGVMVDNEAALEADQAKNLCMKLINQGGPAFQVGQAIYKEYMM